MVARSLEPIIPSNTVFINHYSQYRYRFIIFIFLIFFLLYIRSWSVIYNSIIKCACDVAFISAAGRAKAESCCSGVFIANIIV